VQPRYVVEVSADHIEAGRFRHGSRLLRWRDDKEPEACTMATVPTRVAARGNPWADVEDDPQELTPLLAMYERDLASGLEDAPWPPVYPKMPGEPPRVAPSRAKKKA